MEPIKLDNKVLAKLLAAYDNIGDKDFNTFLEEQMTHLGLNKKQKEYFRECCAMLDKIDNKVDELATAKEDGATTEQWLTREVESAFDSSKEKPTDSASDEEKAAYDKKKVQFVSDLKTALEESIDEQKVEELFNSED